MTALARSSKQKQEAVNATPILTSAWPRSRPRRRAPLLRCIPRHHDRPGSSRGWVGPFQEGVERRAREGLRWESFDGRSALVQPSAGGAREVAVLAARPRPCQHGLPRSGSSPSASRSGFGAHPPRPAVEVSGCTGEPWTHPTHARGPQRSSRSRPWAPWTARRRPSRTRRCSTPVRRSATRPSLWTWGGIPRRPDVLLILADDLGCGDVG